MLSLFYNTVEKLKGSRVLIPVETINDSDHRYEIGLTDGSYLYIYCNELKYKLKYKRWWVPNKKITIYHVFSVITNNDNEEIIKNFRDKVIYITNIYPRSGPVENRKKAAINAFIDIIGYQMKSIIEVAN